MSLMTFTVKSFDSEHVNIPFGFRDKWKLKQNTESIFNIRFDSLRRYITLQIFYRYLHH
ncbi:hypothetical protein ECP03047993_0281 [Escherichia coli P0304799.3]|nr:hypothetical protein ECP03047993_0281 [Escherichia coli P0304799.3]